MISCSDITYLEYARIAVRSYDKVSHTQGLPEEKQDAIREHIVAEFQELTGDMSYRNYQKLFDDLKKHSQRYEKYINFYNVLMTASELNIEIINVLEENGIRVRDSDTLETLRASLFARAKKAELQYKSVAKELERIKEQNKNIEEITEANLLRVIAAVSTGLMFSISVHDNAVVVAEYINILNKQQEKYGNK